MPGCVTLKYVDERWFRRNLNAIMSLLIWGQLWGNLQIKKKILNDSIPNVF